MKERTLIQLYRHGREQNLSSLSPFSLSCLLSGTLSVLEMITCMPWLEPDYENRKQIVSRIREIATMTEEKLRTTAIEKKELARYLSELLDAAHCCRDESLLQRMLDSAHGLLFKENASESTEASDAAIVRLLCTCYYHVQEKSCIEVAQKTVDRWQSGPKTVEGCWPDISLVEVIERLAAINLLDTVICDESHRNQIERGTAYCLSHLAQSKTFFPEARSLQEFAHAIRMLFRLVPYSQFRSFFTYIIQITESTLDVLQNEKEENLSFLRYAILAPYVFSELDYRTMQRYEQIFSQEGANKTGIHP